MLVLALALALLQSFGVAHRVVHGGFQPAPVHASGAPHGAPFAGLFDAHAAGDATCLGLDHAALGDVDVGVPALPLVAALPGEPPAPFEHPPALAAQASGHLARGPPAFA